MIELRVSANDGLFGGTTHIYTTWEAIRDLRNRLQGFPRTTDDVVEEVVGTLGGYSYLRLRFHCVGGTGRAQAEVEMEKSQQQDGPLDFRPRAKLYVSFKAAAMDEFVSQIDALLAEKKGLARLATHDA